jgi:hypothetical protein
MTGYHRRTAFPLGLKLRPLRPVIEKLETVVSLFRGAARYDEVAGNSPERQCCWPCPHCDDGLGF